MSLQVWLPFNGDFNNQGLNGQVKVTNYNVEIDNSGKIGKCGSFNGTNAYLQFSGLNMDSWANFTITFWCYTTVSLAGIFLIRQTQQHQFNISATGISFRDTKHSSTIINLQFDQPEIEKWTHCAIVYKNGSFYIYQNGIKIFEQIYANSATLKTGLNEIRIGRAQSTSGNTYYNGKINDFRIYDHALSAQEVARLAQGLILHYPLSSPSDVLVPSGYQQLEYLESTGTQYIDTGMKGNLNTAIEIKAKVNSNSTSQRLFGSRSSATSNNIAFATSASQMTADFGNYNNTRLQATVGTNIFIAYNSASKRFIDSTIATTQYTRAFTTPSNLYLFDCYNGFGDGSWNGRVYYCKIWDGANIIRYFIPAKRLSDNVLGMYDVITKTFFTNAGTGTFTAGPNAPVSSPVYDISGYKNHGTVVGNLTAAAGSPRYKSAIYSSTGVSNYISGPALNENAKTLSLWIKADFAAGNFVIFADNASQLLLANTSTKGLVISRSSTNTFSTANIVNNNWNHIVLVVQDDGTKICYINGILAQQNSTTDYYRHDAGSFLLFRRRYNNSYSMTGYLSDVRIYVTALSADDVAELYALGKV